MKFDAGGLFLFDWSQRHLSQFPEYFRIYSRNLNMLNATVSCWVYAEYGAEYSTVHESKPIQECLPKIITEKFDY